MTQVLAADPGVLKYRWTPERFLLAWEAGVFEGQRVELLNGEVVSVPIGRWHSRTAVRLIKRLPDTGVEITGETLPSGTSLPDPDVWVCRAGAEPEEQLSKRIFSWAASDVLLVVEVSDETKALDLAFKAQLYGSAGYPEYWMVTKDKVYVHHEPHPTGYRSRIEYLRGQQIPVPYAPGKTVDVAELLSSDGSGDDH
ncbi:MAG: Uma2 family endonuclease [Segniliparus sp.]|uniref:Uma2 family endonuclease n=1 Tax=Segniliparus sp. TaxID=2804064 RepID=UPI003F3B1070